MRGKRAKILRKWAKYDMQQERKDGRQYRVMVHKYTNSQRLETVGARAVYKELKRRTYANKRRSAASLSSRRAGKSRPRNVATMVRDI